MQYFSVRNFEKYQHGHTRDYPWIKLHKSIINDHDFMRLPEVNRWHYLGLLVVASQTNNCIPLDVPYLKNMLHCQDQMELTPLFKAGFLLAKGKHSASKMLAQIKSRVEESRVEGEPASTLLAGPPKTMKRSFPEGFVFTTEMREWANKKGCPDAGRQFERFKAHHIARDSLFSNWEMAWRNWLLKSVEMKEERRG